MLLLLRKLYQSESRCQEVLIKKELFQYAKIAIYIILQIEGILKVSTFFKWIRIYGICIVSSRCMVLQESQALGLEFKCKHIIFHLWSVILIFNMI